MRGIGIGSKLSCECLGSFCCRACIKSSSFSLVSWPLCKRNASAGQENREPERVQSSVRLHSKAFRTPSRHRQASFTQSLDL